MSSGSTRRGRLPPARAESERRRASASAPSLSPSSSSARSRASGVRRSWATLSSDPVRPAIRASMRSSIPLNRRDRSSRGSPSPRTGTRTETCPVRTIPPSTALSRRSGARAERVMRTPPTTAKKRLETKSKAAAARKRRRMSERTSVLLPTWKSVPSPRRIEATSKAAPGPGRSVQPGSDSEPGATRLRRSRPIQDDGTLAKRASARDPSTRTKRPSCRPAMRSEATASRTASRPLRRYCSTYCCSAERTRSRSRCARAEARRA